MLFINNLSGQDRAILAAALNAAGVNISLDNLSSFRGGLSVVAQLPNFFVQKGLNKRKVIFLQKVIDKISNPDTIKTSEDSQMPQAD